MRRILLCLPYRRHVRTHSGNLICPLYPSLPLRSNHLKTSPKSKFLADTGTVPLCGVCKEWVQREEIQRKPRVCGKKKKLAIWLGALGQHLHAVFIKPFVWPCLCVRKGTDSTHLKENPGSFERRRPRKLLVNSLIHQPAFLVPSLPPFPSG